MFVFNVYSHVSVDPPPVGGPERSAFLDSPLQPPPELFSTSVQVGGGDANGESTATASNSLPVETPGNLRVGTQGAQADLSRRTRR